MGTFHEFIFLPLGFKNLQIQLKVQRPIDCNASGYNNLEKIKPTMHTHEDLIPVTWLARRS